MKLSTFKIKMIMKPFTDIKQSKELAEILPIDTADGFYEAYINPKTEDWEYVLIAGNQWASPEVVVPAWSLAALLEIIPNQLDEFRFLLFPCYNSEWGCCYENDNAGYYDVKIKYSAYGESPIDACVEMILILKEEKIL